MADTPIDKSNTSVEEVHEYLARLIAEEADRIVKEQGFLPGRYDKIFVPSETGDLSIIYRGDLSEYHEQLTKASNEATLKIISTPEHAEIFVGLLLGVARQGKNWADRFGADAQ